MGGREKPSEQLKVGSLGCGPWVTRNILGAGEKEKNKKTKTVSEWGDPSNCERSFESNKAMYV